MDQIPSAEATFIDTMNGFYEPFMENFEQAKAAMYKSENKPTGELCPVCHHPLVYKKNRKGQSFVGCPNYPACRYIQKEETKVEYVGEDCPECHHPLVYKTNAKNQRFIGCSNYPTCHYTRDENAKAKKTKITYTEKDYVKECPSCHKGHLVVKIGKRAKFLGCTNFPRCRYIEWLENKKTKENKE